MTWEILVIPPTSDIATSRETMHTYTQGIRHDRICSVVLHISLTGPVSSCTATVNVLARRTSEGFPLYVSRTETSSASPSMR